MPEIITRKEALQRGLKRFFTGKPCQKGHLAERNVRSGACLECNRLMKGSEKYRTMHNARLRERYATDPEFEPVG